MGLKRVCTSSSSAGKRHTIILWVRKWNSVYESRVGSKFSSLTGVDFESFTWQAKKKSIPPTSISIKTEFHHLIRIREDSHCRCFESTHMHTNVPQRESRLVENRSGTAAAGALISWGHFGWTRTRYSTRELQTFDVLVPPHGKTPNLYHTKLQHVPSEQSKHALQVHETTCNTSRLTVSAATVLRRFIRALKCGFTFTVVF